ncbi:MAG: T9SS type A sorting domain-containing protein, partial [Flavobacteriales bacterium]|nr:T9SS type A sorting domain-containing protein [Flavobacteriales bacterium]
RETLAGLEVWPVPVHDVLFLRCPSTLGPDARLQVLDVQGRLVHGERIGPMPTGGTVQLNIDDLAPGTYLLRVEDARQAVLLQWVKE